MVKAHGWWWQTTLLAVLLAGIVLAAGYWRWGSLNGMNAYIQGRALVLEQSVIDLGKRPADDVTLTFKLENHSGETFNLVGGSAECTCVVLGDFPKEIPPYATKDLVVELHGKNEAGTSLEIHGTWYTDCPGLLQIPFAIRVHWQ